MESKKKLQLNRNKNLDKTFDIHKQGRKKEK